MDQEYVLDGVSFNSVIVSILLNRSSPCAFTKKYWMIFVGSKFWEERIFLSKFALWLVSDLSRYKICCQIIETCHVTILSPFFLLGAFTFGMT